MHRLKLSDATDLRVLFGMEVSSMNKIYFVSDIDHFDASVKEQMLDEIKNKGYELVIFAGNILSFLDCAKGAPLQLMGQSDLLYDVFLAKKRKQVRNPEIKEHAVSRLISDHLLRQNSAAINEYYSFVRDCRSLKVPIIYFTGTRDFMLNKYQKDWFTPSNKIPLVKKIKDKTSIAKKHGYVYYPSGDLEFMRLNDDLYVLGINARESSDSVPPAYPHIRKLAGLEDPIEEPHKIILVSHTPATEKYRKCGSKDITDFKRKLKFRFHIHGHCDRYYGVYIGENSIPTRSAHFEAKPQSAKTIRVFETVKA